jgi:toxin ParE1/3/4
MGVLAYSSRAEDDYLEIAIYGAEQFGIVQADRYIDQLEQACERIADFPGLGRRTDSDVFRFEEGSHVIFYRREANRVTVSRILHKSCDPIRHVI